MVKVNSASSTSMITDAVTIATHGASVPLVMVVSFAGMIWSKDHANMLRTMMVNMTNSSKKCHRKKLRPMIVFTIELVVSTRRRS